MINSALKFFANRTIRLSFVVIVGFVIIGAGEEPRKRVDVNVEEVARRKSGGGTPKNRLSRSAVFAIEVEGKLRKSINQTIKFYKKQASRTSKGSKTRLSYLERIMQLNLEQASYVRSDEERSYDKKYTAWDLEGRKGPEPKLNTAKSTEHWKEVIEVAKQITGEFPQNANADKVIFTEAFALQYIGKEKDAARIYTQLTQKYKNSAVAGDAYASLGDFYFDRNDFRNAASNYERALKYRRSDRFLWSYFKLGWCHYNLGQNKMALKQWKQVVTFARASGGEKGLRIRDEALRDMVYAFAEEKDVQGAIAYYRANGGGKYIGTLLMLLARELADDGNYKEGVKTLQLYQRLLPDSPEAPMAQKELILLTFELNQFNVVWKELDRFKNLYGVSSNWAKRNETDKKLILETQQMIKDQMLYYAKVLHKRAQKEDSIPLHKQAKVGYLVFLRNNPSAKELVEVKYNIADIEYFLKNYRAAGQQYLEIVASGPDKAVIFAADGSGKPTNVHNQSAIYMVGAYGKDFESEFKEMQKTKPDFKAPKPISLRAKNYIKSCELFTKFYPKDEERIKTCETDTARIYYFSNDKVQSQKFLWVIATKYPKSKFGPEAVEFLIPLYRSDKRRLYEIADQLLKIPAYTSGDLGKKLRELRRSVEKEQIYQVGDPIKRAKEFEALARKSPNDPEVDKLWFNAAVNYLEGGDVASAITSYLVIVKQYPKSEQAETSLLEVAKLYQKRLDFGVSAPYFEQYAKTYPNSKTAKGAYAAACDLLVAVESKDAVATCINYAKKYPKEGIVGIARLIMAEFRNKDYGQMINMINQTYLRLPITPNERIVANYMVYRAAKADGPQGAAAANAILQAYNAGKAQVSGEALRYVGELVFRQASIEAARYSKLKLEGGTVEKLQGSIERKTAGLVKLKSVVDKVLMTKDSFWGVAALYQLGSAHEEMAIALKSPPAIPGAKEKDVAKQLEPLANQFQKDSLDFYKTGLEIVEKFNVHSVWTVKIVDAYNKASGSSLRFDDVVIEPDFLASDIPAKIAEALGREGS